MLLHKMVRVLDLLRSVGGQESALIHSQNGELVIAPTEQLELWAHKRMEDWEFVYVDHEYIYRPRKR